MLPTGHVIPSTNLDCVAERSGDTAFPNAHPPTPSLSVQSSGSIRVGRWLCGKTEKSYFSTERTQFNTAFNHQKFNHLTYASQK
jgi:hypothetical protein